VATKQQVRGGLLSHPALNPEAAKRLKDHPLEVVVKDRHYRITSYRPGAERVIYVDAYGRSGMAQKPYPKEVEAKLDKLQTSPRV